MSLGPWQLILIVLVILVLFGRGRISELMGDFGKGIKSFKKGLNEDEQPSATAPPPAQIPASDSANVSAKTGETTKSGD